MCIERQTSCEYTTLPTESHLTAQRRRLSDFQIRNESYETLFAIIRNRQTDEANLIFQRIRAGADVESVLKSIQDGDLLLQLALRPEWRYRYRFPGRRHEMPSYLDVWPNPYLGSRLHEKSLVSQSQQHTLVQDVSNVEDEAEHVYLAPYHAVEMVDLRLSSVDVTKWTAVSSNKALLRALLEIYFIFEYPFHPAFHKDIFLDAMIARDGRFCSSLLVNAVLAAAWVRIPTTS